MSTYLVVVVSETYKVRVSSVLPFGTEKLDGFGGGRDVLLIMEAVGCFSEVPGDL